MLDRDSYSRKWMTRAELAQQLGISVRTLQRRIKKLDLTISPGKLNIGEQNIIMSALNDFDLEKSNKHVEDSDE